MLKSIWNLARSPIIEGLCLQKYLYLPILHENSRYLHITSANMGVDKRVKLVNVLRRDDGTEGENIIDINTLKIADMFPNADTPNRLFNGIPFKEIPILNIKCTPNNTLFTITNHKGVVKLCHTCGSEGFKNTRKGTNVAAQATAISLSTKALEQGYKTFRVRVRGLGPGRTSAIKGLQMGGLEIISITDYTPVSWSPPRPRKPKRL